MCAFLQAILFLFGCGRFFCKVFFVLVFMLNGVLSFQRVSFFFFSKGGFFFQEFFKVFLKEKFNFKKRDFI